MPRGRSPRGVSPIVAGDRMSRLPSRHSSSPRLQAPLSPHLVLDRITGHATNRHHHALKIDIIPKTKQPYRTSFSAVTAPYRIPRESNLQSTLVGHGSLGHDSLSGPDRGANLQTFVTKSVELVDGSPAKPRTSSPVGFERNGVRYASTPNSIRGAGRRIDSGGSRARATSGGSSAYNNGALQSISSIRSDEVFVDHTPSPEVKVTTPGGSTLEDTDVSSFMKNTDPDGPLMNGGLVVDIGPSDYSASVKPRELVEVQYTHCAKITYAELVENISSLPPANKHTRHALYAMLNLCGRTLSAESLVLDEELNSEKSYVPCSRVKVNSVEAETPVVFKSQSTTSVWNVFKGFSPRAIRSRRRARSLGPDHAHKSSEKSLLSSDNSLHVVNEDITDEGKVEGSPNSVRKSPRPSPKTSRFFRLMHRDSRKRSTDNMLGGGSEQNVNLLQARNKSQRSSRSTSRLRLWIERRRNSNEDVHIDSSNSSTSPMPTASAKLLKSMNPAQDKSVYKAFKDRQSPSQPREAISLKPQPLRPVEIPDSLLQKPNPSNSDISPQEPEVSAAQGASPRVRPPSSLEIRGLSSVGRQKFFQSMSTDSIGECSLNISTTGSDPSLTSRNGRSQASKRTLHSESTSMDTPTLNHTETPTLSHTGTPTLNNQSSQDEVDNQVKSNYVTSRILSLESTNGDIDPDKLIKVSPKAPSYLKLSCSVSGYHKSNSCIKNDLNKNSFYDRNNILQDRLVKDKCNKEQLINAVNDSHKTDNNSQNGCIDSDEFSRSNGHDLDLDSTIPVMTNGAISQSEVSRENSRTNNEPHAVEPRTNSTSGSLGFHQVELVAPSHTKTSPEHQTGHSQVTQNGYGEDDSLKKNGTYFLDIVNGEEGRLRSLVTNMEGVLNNTADIPDEASGLIRATIGKSNLLITKKFVQYKDLCHKNLHPDPSDFRETTDADLAGLWDIINIQTSDLGAMFNQINILMKNGWKTPVMEKKSAISTPVKITHTKQGKSRVPKNTFRDSEAAKARDEARTKAREEAKKRLMAAKKAGRQRKASQSDDVEIYVPT